MKLADIKDKILYDVLGRVPRDRPFVFGIGLSKTGTTSLNDALDVLGYRAFHLPPIVKAESDGGLTADWPWWVWKYNALTDLTVAVLHRDLQAQFPNASFIYTRRPMDRWLASCEKHFTQDLREARIAQGQTYLAGVVKSFYGSEVFERSGFEAAYLRHEAEVMALHEGKANFMSYDLTQGQGWDPLCSFLGKPVPDAPFPNANKAAVR